jgi:hypothetical protein
MLSGLKGELIQFRLIQNQAIIIVSLGGTAQSHAQLAELEKKIAVSRA